MVHFFSNTSTYRDVNGILIGEQNNFKIECLSTLTPTILSNQDFEDWYMVNRGEWVLRGVCCFLCYML